MIKHLVFFTGNSHKFQRLSSSLKVMGIELIQNKAYLNEIQAYEVKEVALHKAFQARAIIEDPLLTHDSGFYIEALNGFPGALTKPVMDQLGSAGILKLLDGGSNRRCQLKAALCLSLESKPPILFEYILNGSLIDSCEDEAGDGWSNWWDIFVPEDRSKALSKMTAAEKEDLSGGHHVWDQLREFLSAK